MSDYDEDQFSDASGFDEEEEEVERVSYQDAEYGSEIDADDPGEEEEEWAALEEEAPSTVGFKEVITRREEPARVLVDEADEEFDYEEYVASGAVDMVGQVGRAEDVYRQMTMVEGKFIDEDTRLGKARNVAMENLDLFTTVADDRARRRIMRLGMAAGDEETRMKLIVNDMNKLIASMQLTGVGDVARVLWSIPNIMLKNLRYILLGHKFTKLERNVKHKTRLMAALASVYEAEPIHIARYHFMLSSLGA